MVTDAQALSPRPPAIMEVVRWDEPLHPGAAGPVDDFVLPVGTVTLLLADVEGSVRSWERDADAMARAMERFSALASDAVGRGCPSTVLG